MKKLFVGLALALLMTTALICLSAVIDSRGNYIPGTIGPPPGPGDTILVGTNAVAPAPVPNGGWLWNSNKVLFWITTTKTNLISDGR